MGQKMITGTHGIPAIIRAAKQFQILVTEELLRHKLGIDCQELTWIDVCRAARAVGLRAKYYEEISGDLQTLPVPILVCLANQWSVIEKVETEYWWRYDVAIGELGQELLPTANNSKYNLPIILLAEQEVQITDVKFGFNWFLPSILRHINQLRDVLALSLMLQLIALVGPKLFQNVIDRVLVSRGVSSLKVLAIAILALALAEPLFSYLRGKIFSNIASKINSELSGM